MTIPITDSLQSTNIYFDVETAACPYCYFAANVDTELSPYFGISISDFGIEHVLEL